MVNRHNNIARIRVIARALAELNQKVVFVGGAVVDLYADDPARGEVRPTEDVDVVIEVINRAEYATVEEKLRQIGFQNMMMSKVICRYTYQGIIVDIMPNDDEILGFTNRWYKDGLNQSITYHLEENLEVALFSVAHFLASKLEALKSERHGKDYRWNSDFEDIVYVFDTRTTILEDLQQAPIEVRQYLAESLESLLKRPFVEEEIMANLEFSSQLIRKDRILTIWRRFLYFFKPKSSY